MGVSEAQAQPCRLSLNVLEVTLLQLNFPSLVCPKKHQEDTYRGLQVLGVGQKV